MIRKFVATLYLASAGLFGFAAEATPTLASREECVSFRWDPNPTGSAKGAISVPVTLNGKAMWFRLDTGTNVDILYGNIADKAGWAKAGSHHFRAAELVIGNTRISGAPISIMRDQPVAETSGEIGLADLVGRVAVIDYPGRHFCLFAAAAAPPELRQDVRWIEADLRNGKLFVPVTLPGFARRNVVFDTGSSELPLWVDLTSWQQITGLQNPQAGQFHVGGSHFTQPITFDGARSSGSMLLGDVSLGAPVVYTEENDPEEFRHWPFPVDGIIGNEALIDHEIIIDLADSDTRIGLIEPH